ncbi:CpXC domain-containing protein [Acetobacterium bakii]|uniref:CpXC domain-containing protein n=1 Tax=Acetobacterium bakii TaxID=52689 RepID=A0A0L6TXG3_9FIRM|nr:CpXC domain-containing protein [Acetobacterium bakii]KNZ40260.1 hypothetical protein AKG39_18610 [Acetobacterium bakii]
MAMKKIVAQTCPNCGEYFDIEAFEVINVTLDTSLRDEVLNGRIFDFTCPECRYWFRNPYSMVYKDMEKEFTIILDLKNNEALKTENEAKEDLTRETLELFPTYRIRVVTDMTDFIEKIHIFSADLNDRVIAYLDHKIKRYMIAKMEKEKSPIQINRVVFDSLNGNEERVNFGVFGSSPTPIIMNMPLRDYEYLLKKSPLKESFKEQPGEYIVDKDWAEETDRPISSY